jgi:DNA-binding PadR family transcriptional regulator
MNELAILGLLKDQDMHGYELRKRITELGGSRATMSFGSLYPALGRLEKAGYVKAVTSASRPAIPPAPMSGSLAGELAAFRAQRRLATAARRSNRGGRGKKVYGLTDRGAEHLHELLVDADVSDDRDFSLRLTFFLTLTPTERLALLRHRRDVLLRRREEGRRVTKSGHLNRYLRSFLERDTESITADLDWLDRTIAAEQAAIDGDDIPSEDGTTPDESNERGRNR